MPNMNKHLTEKEINLYLQRSLKLAMRYGYKTETGKKILAIASQVALKDLEVLKNENAGHSL